MGAMEITTMSSKGQMVIPVEVREDLGLSKGMKLMVISDGINMLVKQVMTPKLGTFRDLVEKSRRWAKEAGLKRSDIPRLIKKVRRESRH
jgi:antitoxin PrlF